MNNLIASSPNIEVSVSNCQVNTSEIPNSRSFFVEHDTEFATNSCTGQVLTSQIWSSTPELLATLFLGFILIVVFGMCFLAYLNNR